MRIQRGSLVTAALLAFVGVTAITLAVKESRHARAVSAAESARTQKAPAPTSGASTIVVTYFHTTARCPSCLRIEDLTTLTVTSDFSVQLADKRLVWRTVNIDEPENAHYAKDYGLHTKSVVVSEIKAGREVRWKNLEKVWPLLNDQDAFTRYVRDEIRAFLEPA